MNDLTKQQLKAHPLVEDAEGIYFRLRGTDFFISREAERFSQWREMAYFFLT